MDNKQYLQPMNDTVMDKYVQERIEKIKSSLLVKSKEYSRNGDRMHNFNKGSETYKETREKFAYNLMKKQLISFDDMINDLEQGKSNPLDLWHEKIGDIINYLILIEASLKQRYDTDRDV